MNNELLTPLDLYEKYPELKKIGWEPAVLGRLLSAGLLDGHYNRLKRVSLIREGSLFPLLRFRNQILESKKIFVPE